MGAAMDFWRLHLSTHAFFYPSPHKVLSLQGLKGCIQSWLPIQSV